MPLHFLYIIFFHRYLLIYSNAHFSNTNYDHKVTKKLLYANRYLFNPNHFLTFARLINRIVTKRYG